MINLANYNHILYTLIITKTSINIKIKLPNAIKATERLEAHTSQRPTYAKYYHNIIK